MKLIIKNLKQVTYNVEVPSEKTTIADLKKEIEKSHGFDSSQLKLLHNGVILVDEKILEDYKIQEENVIIMMNTKVKPKNVQSTEKSESSQPKAEEKKPEEKKPEEKKPEESKPQEKKEPKPQEEKYTQQLNSLVDMGFEKSQAEAAIKAARGQIDLAIEFLYNGIPEGINDNNMDFGGAEEGEAEGDDNNEEEDPLKNVASIAKVLCQNNPSALSTLLQGIQNNDPDLMALINEHEDEFKSYLEQPVTDEDYRAFQRFQQQMGLGIGGGEHGHEHGGSGSGRIRISLTPEEQAAVTRLKDLGNFSESDVLQAYFACEKNEELTANYLFEQKMRDDDEMFKNKNNNNNNNNNNGASQ